MTIKGLPKKSVKTQTPEYSDFLMWVGSVYYPTADSYIREAKERGVCKRLGKVPTDLAAQFAEGSNTKTRIFLAHDDGVVGEGFIFGYFIPTEIQYIFSCFEEDIPYYLADFVKPVPINEILDEDPRECGERFDGAYAVTLTRVIETDFVVFDQPRDLNKFDNDRSHFRGLLYIDYGDKVINATPEQCTIPASKRAAVELKTGPVTAKEDAFILKHMGRGVSISHDAQKLAYKLGRTKNQIMYRYQVLTKDSDEEEGDEDE